MGCFYWFQVDFMWNLLDFIWNLPDFLKSTGFHMKSNFFQQNELLVIIKYRRRFHKILRHSFPTAIHKTEEFLLNYLILRFSSGFHMKSTWFHEIHSGFHENCMRYAWNSLLIAIHKTEEFLLNYLILRFSGGFHMKSAWNPHEICQISPEIHQILWNLPNFTWNLPDFKIMSFWVITKYRSFFQKTKHTKDYLPTEVTPYISAMLGQWLLSGTPVFTADTPRLLSRCDMSRLFIYYQSGNFFYQKSTIGTTIAAIEANNGTYCLQNEWKSSRWYDL